jgi:hypothetical protein
VVRRGGRGTASTVGDRRGERGGPIVVGHVVAPSRGCALGAMHDPSHVRMTFFQSEHVQGLSPLLRRRSSATCFLCY